MNETFSQQSRRRRTFTGSRAEGSEFDHEVLEVARVVRVVKGGRRFRFRATVVVGDRSGRVGLGIAKSRDVQQAITKAQSQAVKGVVRVPLKKGTINDQLTARFKGAHILLKPAKPGTGLIAGGTVRMVADMAGVTDLVSKQLGSANKINNAKAAIKALASR
jgi:small subunit ribosomal protein S5